MTPRERLMVTWYAKVATEVITFLFCSLDFFWEFIARQIDTVLDTYSHWYVHMLWLNEWIFFTFKHSLKHLNTPILWFVGCSFQTFIEQFFIFYLFRCLLLLLLCMILSMTLIQDFERFTPYKNEHIQKNYTEKSCDGFA